MTPPHVRRARVVHVVSALAVGGLERVVIELVRRLDRDRFEPVVCALEGGGALEAALRAASVPIFCLGSQGGLEVSLAARLALWLRAGEFDLVHTHNPRPHVYGVVGALASGRRAARVHTKHGRNHPHLGRRVLLNRSAAARTDRLVAVSQDVADVLLRIERVPPAKVTTIPNGIDVDRFAPRDDGRAVRASLGLPAGAFVVGTVARLGPEKDQATLLAAFAELRRHRTEAHLVLCGDGPCRGDLEARARSLGIAESVRFLGTRGDVERVLAAFDVFALSSVTEGTSLTLLEAAASGLPIVATRVGGNAEVVAEGVTGLLAPPRDPGRFAQALRAMAAFQDRTGWGERGRARVVERYALSEMVRRYERLYVEVLEERGRRAQGGPSPPEQGLAAQGLERARG